jgi:hypothetical protein
VPGGYRIAVTDGKDWRLAAGEELRGASFVRVAWTPPPAEWVAVQRDEQGRVTWLALRREPGPRGWGAGERPVWDHDHCELCQQRLTDDPAYEDGKREGWRTGPGWGSYTWVCERCFEGLRERLGWRVAAPGQQYGPRPL